MQISEIYQRLGAAAIVPVVTLVDASTAVPLADALWKNGLPLVEVTFRTAAASAAIEILTRERTGVLVGAGTILTREHLKAARLAGAHFAVAPGLNPDIVKEAQAMGLAFIPGVATPSEIEQALSLGCRTLKFFPAEQLGGVEMIVALAGPYGQTGVKFVPTGGVNLSNLQSYLECKSVLAVGGTWLAKSNDLASGNWDELGRRCQTAVQLVRQVRASWTAV